MTSEWSRRWRDLSIRCYRFLLLAYPKAFLNSYEDQLKQSFRDLAREEIDGRGIVGLVMLWVRVFPDLFSTAVRHRAAAIKKENMAVFFAIALWIVPWVLIAPLILLLICALAVIVMLITTVVLAARGQPAAARKTLRRLIAGTATYLGVVIVLPLVNPGKTVPVGETFCPDAVCMVVERVGRTPAGGGSLYNVVVRATSNSPKVLDYSKREWMIYLKDNRGNRFPSTDPKSVPGFILKPTESRTFQFTFLTPSGARHLFFDAEDLGTPPLLGILMSLSLVTASRFQIQ